MAKDTRITMIYNIIVCAIHFGKKLFDVKWSRGFFKTDKRLNVKKSWTEADELCRSAGGTLPIIRSKDELDELISLVQFEKGLPPIELIYMGLQFNPQVSKFLL